MNTFRRTVAFAAALALTTAAALADRIYLTNGTSLDGVDIANETLAGVTYRAKGKSGEQSVQADQVLRVEYAKLPRLVDEALSDAEDDNLQSAIDTLSDFANGVLSGENKRDKQLWAPGYALYRAIEFCAAVASQESLQRIVTLSDTLVEKLPDSRYVPLALISKASALRDLGKGKEAGETITALRTLVSTKALSEAFKLEADLLDIETGSLKGQQRRDKLLEVQGKAGSQYPLVKSRARVLEAQTYIEGETKDFSKARQIYDAVIKDPKADDATLAGAYTGMGDCLFQEASEKFRTGGDASVILRDAVLSYLRVVLVYKDQSRYVPKAMFQAGRTFEMMGEGRKPDARRMYSSVIQHYPGSEWASLAKSARK